MPDWSKQTPYSDPGAYADRLAAVPADLDEMSAVARNVIVHYRATREELPASSADDINLRWLSAILETDEGRHPQPLTEHRPKTERVQGCCRDHTLFCLGVLRQQGRAARSRVGFAGYFTPGFHHDHVIVEVRDGDRWRRFDPEVDVSSAEVGDCRDLATGPGAPFQTAAEVYQLYRAGAIDPSTYGVAPELPVVGDWFIEGEVIYEVAHRYGDELLLWDDWGAMPEPGEAGQPETLELLDRVADLLVRADAGDDAAETELEALYRSDDRLHPGKQVLRMSPRGAPPVMVSLER